MGQHQQEQTCFTYLLLCFASSILFAAVVMQRACWKRRGSVGDVKFSPAATPTISFVPASGPGPATPSLLPQGAAMGSYDLIPCCVARRQQPWCV
jgi:hypothetical protein